MTDVAWTFCVVAACSGCICVVVAAGGCFVLGRTAPDVVGVGAGDGLEVVSDGVLTESCLKPAARGRGIRLGRSSC